MRILCHARGWPLTALLHFLNSLAALVAGNCYSRQPAGIHCMLNLSVMPCDWHALVRVLGMSFPSRHSWPVKSCTMERAGHARGAWRNSLMRALVVHLVCDTLGVGTRCVSLLVLRLVLGQLRAILELWGCCLRVLEVTLLKAIN